MGFGHEKCCHNPLWIRIALNPSGAQHGGRRSAGGAAEKSPGQAKRSPGFLNRVKTLGDQRLANIMKYADNYEKMTDATADEIALRAMDIDSQRAAIRKKYYGQMKTALGARAAARFLQTEATLDCLMDLQIGAAIPLIP